MADSRSPTQTSMIIDARREQVFAALADARTYPEWLVGAQRIRHVDDAWPAKGASFHHTVGAGPFHVKDRTTILEFDEPRELRLRASIGPMGAAYVRFVLEPEDGCTRVEFFEEPASGPIRLLWNTLGRPLMRLGIWGRNASSLEQLKSYVEAARP